MPLRWNPLSISFYSSILGAAYGLISSLIGWDSNSDGIATAIGFTVGGGLGAAFLVGLIAVVRNGLIFGMGSESNPGRHGRLGGWSRIGIVASVVWCTAAFAYGWIEQRNSNTIVALRHMDLARDGCLQAGNKTGVDCVIEGHRAYTVMENGQLDPVMSGAALAFVPLPFFWLFTALLLGAIRWVRAGFRNEAQHQRR